jgi:hypothetical protein
MHLECPDPEEPARLRLWVEKSWTKRPQPLGVTMGDAGNTYDQHPPARFDPNQSKRHSAKRDKAKGFIVDALARDNDQIANELCGQWQRSGESKPTFWRAVEALEDADEIVRDGGPGAGKPTVLHLVDPEAAADTNAAWEPPCICLIVSFLPGV